MTLPNWLAPAGTVLGIAVGLLILSQVPSGAKERPLQNMGYTPPLDNDRLLEAIKGTEDWDGDSIGAAGELGPWQMLPLTWHTYSHETMPYTRGAWDEAEPQRVIHAHASWIRDRMERLHLPQTPYTFALFWKAGYGRVTKHKLRGVDRDYASRAQNIYTAP